MVDLPLKFEAGGQEQFTLVTSVALDENPLFYMKMGETLVYSSTGASSGSGHYYEYATIPSSKGLYTAHWIYAINNQSFYTEPDIFEVVQRLALDVTSRYCAYSDVVNMYEPLRDMDLTAGEIDEKVLDVQARIDARLGKRYSVPFAPGVNSLPPVIKTIAKNLTLVDIIQQTGRVPDWINDLKMDINSLLGGIADGEVTLVLPDGAIVDQAPPTAFARADHNLEDYTPTFNMLGAEYQRVDPDRLDDEEDAL
jgi:phage gp36-like protein